MSKPIKEYLTWGLRFLPAENQLYMTEKCLRDQARQHTWCTCLFELSHNKIHLKEAPINFQIFLFSFWAWLILPPLGCQLSTDRLLLAITKIFTQLLV